MDSAHVAFTSFNRDNYNAAAWFRRVRQSQNIRENKKSNEQKNENSVSFGHGRDFSYG